MYHNSRHKLLLFFFEPISNTNIHICDNNAMNTLSTYCSIKAINIYSQSKLQTHARLDSQLYAIQVVGHCRLWNGQGLSVSEGPWEEMKSIPRDTTCHKTVGHFTPLLFRGGKLSLWRTTLQSPLGCLLRQCRVRGVYYYPYPPRVPFYVDLRLEIWYAFAHSVTKDI